MQEIKTIIDKLRLPSVHYKEYKEILSDIEKTDDYFTIRKLVTLFYAELKNVARFPIWRKQNGQIVFVRQNYKNLADLDEVEQCVLEGFWKVLSEIRRNPSIIEGRPLADIKRIVTYRVRNASIKRIYQVLRFSERKMRVEMEEKISKFPVTIFETEKDITNRLLIKEVVCDFLAGRDKLDTLLFFAVFTEVYLYGYGKTPINLTQRDIAKICGVSENTVWRRKTKLMKEFQEFCSKRLLPYFEC